MLYPVKWRLRDENTAIDDQLLQMAIEERQEQRSNVRTVDIGIGHDDDAVIAQLRYVELVSNRCSERGYQSSNLLVLKHFVEACLFDVQDLAAKWQNCLES